MIHQGWLQMRMRGTKFTLIAYPNVPKTRFTRLIDLDEYIPGICGSEYGEGRKESIAPEQVVFYSRFACLELWPEKKDSLRSNIFLPPILWKD